MSQKKTKKTVDRKPPKFRDPRQRGSSVPAPLPPSTELYKLDLGCGPNKNPGYTGVDQYAFPGVDIVCNLGDRAIHWPFPDESVEAVHCSHFLEHLTGPERVHFMNELHRVLMPGAKAYVVTPYWASGRAYGDFTHAWPPVSEMYFYYLSAEWRAQNAPHCDKRWNPDGYDCDFVAGWGYNPHPSLIGKSDEVQQFNITFYKEAAQDLLTTLTKKPAAPPT